MNTFHPQFPYGKGIWIWNLNSSEGGDITKIIAKCKQYDISYVIIKTADGNNSWAQLTKEITDQFHANNIKVYSWSYVYGSNPSREADLVLWSIEQLGVDGHIIDAESEYEHLANNAIAAEAMFQKIRAKQPNAFIAHAPFPIIDYHTGFPYVTFGKYCDAVMPQLYWGTIGMTVPKMVDAMFAQWVKWQDSWTASGHGDSVKPIIPLGQSYDNPSNDYVCNPSELTDFITRLSGYGSVNFWVWEYTKRPDLWGAIRDAHVKSKEELNATPANNQNTAVAPSGTTQTTTPAPVIPPAPETPAPVENNPANTTIVTPGNNENPKKTTTPVVSTPPAAVVPQPKRHIDYFIEFFTMIFHVMTLRRRTKGGGKNV